MGFDATLRRYFGVVNLSLIAIAAYFHAAGIGQLIAGLLAPPGAWFGGRSEGARSPPVTADDHMTSARAILDRNPFDSKTPRPLDAIPAAADGGSSSDVPACEEFRALIAVASWNPAWSMAAISGGPDARAKLVRAGEDFGGKTVELVEWNRVVLSSGSARCEMVMFRSPKVATAPTSKVEAVPVPIEVGSVPQEIASKIRRIGPKEFDVDRQAIAEIIEKQADLMKIVRIAPFQQNGKVVGLLLFGVRPGTLLGMLGLEHGDLLQTINGFDLTNPESAMLAFARLRTADHLTVQVNRRGQDMNLDFNIK